MAELLVEELGRNGGHLTDGAMLAAGHGAWPGGMAPMSDERVLKKVKAALNKPDVRAAIGDAYFRAAGYSVLDGLRDHVQHIRDGNYQALKDYLAMTLPKAPARADVRVQHIPAPDRLPGHAGVPAMRARVIGSTTTAALPAGKPRPAAESAEEAVVRDE